MNKKAYQKPAMQVVDLELQTALLAGSGPDAVNATFSDDDIIEEGNVQARPHYGMWD